MVENESKFRKCKNNNKKKKNGEKVFFFFFNCILKCCNKLPFLRRENLLSAVNGLKKSPKILHVTEKAFSNLNFFHRD